MCLTTSYENNESTEIANAQIIPQIRVFGTPFHTYCWHLSKYIILCMPNAKIPLGILDRTVKFLASLIKIQTLTTVYRERDYILPVMIVQIFQRYPSNARFFLLNPQNNCMHFIYYGFASQAQRSLHTTFNTLVSQDPHPANALKH